MNVRAPAFSLLLWSLGSLVRGAPAPERYTYWIEPCYGPAGSCLAGDPQLAQWALEAWQHAAPRALDLVPVKDRDHARIRLFWASAEQGMYGEARPILVDGMKGAEVYVRPAPLNNDGDRLLRDAIVYLTCLHETGHALGLPHTASFDDIMYSFQFGGDIPEYFGRYRRKLNQRQDIRKNSGLSEADKNTLRALFEN